jgi:hypothetical protein
VISGAELIARVQAMQGLASVRTDSLGLRQARDALARFASPDGFGAAAPPSLCAGAASEEARARVSHSCACNGSPCLRHCVHGASIGGGAGAGGGRGWRPHAGRGVRRWQGGDAVAAAEPVSIVHARRTALTANDLGSHHVTMDRNVAESQPPLGLISRINL